MLIVQLDSEQLSNLIQTAVQNAFAKMPAQPSLIEEEKLLTVEDAAVFLSVAVPTIYGLISKGEIPSMKRSKRVYFLKKDLINYMKAGRKQKVA